MQNIVYLIKRESRYRNYCLPYVFSTEEKAKNWIDQNPYIKKQYVIPVIVDKDFVRAGDK